MENAMDMLDALSEMPISVETLGETRIGMIVNELRKKTTNDKVAKAAKMLIKKWKSLLESKSDDKPSSEKKQILPRNESLASNLCDEPPKLKPEKSTNSSATSSHEMNGKPKSYNPDEVRNRCIIMLVNALRHRDLPEDSHDPDVVAVGIEKKLFEVHRGVSEKYKAALRSRVFNLRDKKNVELRDNVLVGAVSPERFATMTSEEMASHEMKKLREKLTKEGIEKHQMSVQEGTPSDMFKCGKCGKKNCTYNQVQTRSADEPMTTFVFCRDCGNRWKFC